MIFLKNLLKADSRKKYHQAAVVYLINGVFFLASFQQGKHDFGVWSSSLYTVGIFLIIIFTVLIFKAYRKVTIMLVVVYAIRMIVAPFKLPFISTLIIIGVVLHTLTCFMLARAAWDVDF